MFHSDRQIKEQNMPSAIQFSGPIGGVSYQIECPNRFPATGDLLDIHLEFDFWRGEGTLAIGFRGRLEEAVSESTHKVISDKLSEEGWLYRKGEGDGNTCQIVFDVKNRQAATLESFVTTLKFLINRLGTSRTNLAETDIQLRPLNDVRNLRKQLEEALPAQ